MTIKKSIVISNILMLLIPVVSIISISTIIKEPFLRLVESKMNDYELNTPGAYFAQDRLRLDFKKLEDEEYFKRLPFELEEMLKPEGYNLFIKYGNEILFSNITENDKKSISTIGSELLEQSNSLVLEVNHISLVKTNFFHKGKVVEIVTINSSYEPAKFDMGKHMRAYFLTYISLVGLISILVITLTNGILSNRIARSIIRPLDLLRYWADQIKKGNLDFEVNYSKDDEFKKVCSDFDEMRIRLKESIDTRIKYEENRKELMAGISHDLRTPLTAIKGYVEGLRDNVANTPEKQKKYLNTIYYKACDMDRLVEELFLFSKLDTGKFPFKFDIIKINDYINNFYLKIKEEFLNKGLEIFLVNDCNEKDKVNIDCKQMDRVLLNIIENSYKYKKDSIGTCKINMYEKENDIVIKISDNGKGVSEEELEKIFISFYRCDPSRTKTNEGSGLGLAIAKQIIDNHKGKIRAYSNNGLVIEILIPKILSD